MASAKTEGGKYTVTHTNNCVAHVFARFCNKRANGTNDCGAAGIDKGKSTSWWTTGGSGGTYEFTGSVYPNKDYVCSDRDPAMEAYKKNYPEGG